MSKRNLIIVGVVVVVLLGAFASAGSDENEPAGDLVTPSPGTSATVSPTVAVVSEEPEPSGSYVVGDRIKLADEEYFGVAEVDLDVAGTEFIKPETGKKWVAALVEIEGINPDGATYNPFFFKVRDEQGFEYNFNLFGKEPQLQSSNDLKPGQIVKGWVNFEVPDTAKTFTLVYAAGFLGEPVEVALN